MILGRRKPLTLSGRGPGQGLAIVHNVVVERHKGTLGFETEPGVGSVFIIRLPAAQPAPV